MKLVLAFVVGALLAGYTVWVLKPSSVESLALNTLTNIADAQAIAERVTYEMQLENAQLELETVSAHAAEAEMGRVAAERDATAARRVAVAAQSRVAQLMPRLETAQDAVTAAQRAVTENPTPDTRGALIDAQRLDISALTATLGTALDSLASTERAYTLLEDAYFTQGQSLTLAQQATDAARALGALATHRVDQLSGRRVRWGVGVTIGCNPLDCSFETTPVVVGLTLMWG